MQSLSRWIVLALTFLSCRFLFAENKPWTEIRSPHFRLMTNGSESDGQHVLRAFELMRAVFESQFPGFKLETPAPLLILAPKDEYTAKELLPQFGAHPGPKLAGMYRQGWEREYAVIRLDLIGDLRDPDVYETVYHEYIHSLLHANFRWLPSWLDEGLSEFYGYTRFVKDKMYIGAPPQSAWKMELLKEKNSIPFETFIKSPMFSRDMEDTQLSYMQAWALTHFLTFGQGMQNGQLLRRFFNELQRGAEEKKAFMQIFGAFDEIQNRYDQYIQKFAFTSFALPVPAQLGAIQFTARPMSLAETDAELAAWHIRFHHWEQVRELTEASLKQDPKVSLAHEDNAFLQFNEGKDDEAVKEFSAAVDLDPKNYIALFAKTMCSPAAKSSIPSDQEVTWQSLGRVVDLKPNFAPAYVELAKIALSRGQMDLALGLSRKAEQLEPFRSGYHLLSGEILLRMNRAAAAAAEAVYVAQRWSGPHRDEALNLWNRIPAADRTSDAPTLDVSQKGTSAEGIVKSVNCNGNAFEMTLEVKGELQKFKSTGFPVGFSDTLWVGQDHFSPCFHVQGLRAMLRYNATNGSSYAGDLIYVGFRDDLGPAKSSVVTQASTH
jgi:tetratricopeptide (TPR) repeat protein